MHILFFFMFDTHMLKNNSIYKYHYFVKKLIKKGDTVIDIGANLGYYSGIFRRLVKNSGKVICFEPMPPFFNVLTWAYSSKTNMTLHNVALGNENKTTKIFQPNPEKSYFRTGLSSIANQDTDLKKGITYDIEMKKGSSLLENLHEIQYIKMDIEGYEKIVLQELEGIIKKYQPIVQVEIWEGNRDEVFLLMEKLSFQPYSLYKNKLIKDFDNSIEPGDYLFIHKSKETEVLERLQN